MISVPVYSDENGLPQISIYVEDEDGTFRRTQSEPLRLLRDDIQGISISQGDMVSSSYDRYDRDWQTPTVTFHYGRPQSFYQFLRDKIAHNRFFVFTKPQLAGHISKFTIHELKLKNSTSQRKLAILKEKYVEALQLWSEEQLEALNAKAANRKAINRNARVGVNKKQQLPPVTPQQRDNVRQMRRSKSQPQATDSVQRSGENATQNMVQHKNRIQDFSLSKPRQRTETKEKEHNKHFYNRFIFTID